jgi:hypothetical protein
MFLMMPLQVGMTVCAIAFCTCFSCFLYFARLFWNHTCSRSNGSAEFCYSVSTPLVLLSIRKKHEGKRTDVVGVDGKIVLMKNLMKR